MLEIYLVSSPVIQAQQHCADFSRAKSVLWYLPFTFAYLSLVFNPPVVVPLFRGRVQLSEELNSPLNSINPHSLLCQVELFTLFSRIKRFIDFILIVSIVNYRNVCKFLAFILLVVNYCNSTSATIPTSTLSG